MPVSGPANGHRRMVRGIVRTPRTRGREDAGGVDLYSGSGIPVSSGTTNTVISAVSRKAVLCVFTIAILLPLAAPCDADDPIDLIDDAARVFQDGKPDSAAVLLYDAIDLVDDRDEKVRAYYYLALALGQLGRDAEKVQYLAAATALSPNSPYSDDVRCEHARTLLASGNTNGCLAITQDFLASRRESPLVPDMLYLTGKVFFEKNEWLKAYNAYSEISKTYPDTPIARMAGVEEGICLFRLNIISGATERFERYLEVNPKGESVADALYYLGLCYERTGQAKRASEMFRRLTIEYPSHGSVIDAFFRLGRNLFEIRKYTESENAFLNYLDNGPRFDPSYDEALLYLERISFRKGYYASEMDIAENFVAKNPRSRLAPKMFLDLARYYRLSGEPDRAIEKYLTLMSQHARTDYADSAMFYIADTYISANRPEDAMSFLRQVAYRRGAQSKSPAAFYKLGLIGEEWLLHDNAIAWYDSAVSNGSSPDLSVRALMGIGRCYRAVNRWLDSSKTYERILHSYPSTPYKTDVCYSLAEVYYLMGRIYDSVQTAKDGLRLAQGRRRIDFLVFLADAYEYIDTDQAIQYHWSVWSSNSAAPSTRTDALLKIGDLYAKRGDRRSAIETFGRIMNGDADSLAVRKARQRIEELAGASDTSDTVKPQ